jgi:hypothetical protein
VIEDMLRMYVINKPSKWDDYFHLVEFSYNNGYQYSLKMSPFEDLYGIKCSTLVSWDNLANKVVFAPNFSRIWKTKWLKLNKILRQHKIEKRVMKIRK